ncbi:MAG: InlB B-repeat-containing protein [Solobacterium sp.]|nr:InlB B-repeat-containing protein [Solobacterium sp.]
MKKTLTMLMAFVLALGHSTGFVYAEETTEPEDEPVQETIVSEETKESEQEITVSEEVEETTEVVSLDADEGHYRITIDASGGYFDDNPEKTTYLIDVEKGNALNYYPWIYSSDPHDICIGWSHTEGGEVELTYDTIMGYVPSSDETLYTVWEKGYVITFDPNGGHIDQQEEGKPYTATIKKGDPLPYQPYITIDDDHKVLDGWAFNKDDENYLKNDYYGYIPESDLTLYAVWKDCYFVTFNPGDGYFPWLGEDKCEVYKVAQGDPLDNSFTPQNDDPDVAIAGWSLTEGSDVIDVEHDYLYVFIPESDVTLYAVWKECYTLTFNTTKGYFPWGGSDNKSYSVKVLKGQPVRWSEYPEIDDSSLTFAGWSRSEDGSVDWNNNEINDYIPSSNETIYAVWSEGYQITFDCNGGYLDWGEPVYTTTKTVVKGEPLYEYYDPVNDNSNLVFAGWNHTKGSDVVEIEPDALYDYIPASGETLYAVWKDGYRITLDFNGGYSRWDEQETAVTFKIPKGERLDRSEYPINDNPDLTLAGWSHSKTGDVEIGRYVLYDYVPSSDETLYAVWKEGYQIILDFNGGYSERDEQETAITIKIPKGERLDRSEYPINDNPDLILAGWSHSKTGDVEIDRYDLSDYVPSSSETLYAVWGKGFKITLDPNGGYFKWREDPTKQIITVVSGKRVNTNSIPVSNTENLVFAGWSRSKTGDVEIDKYELYSYVPSSSETLYAVWTEGYKVTLDTNGGYFEWGEEGEEVVEVEKGKNINTSYELFHSQDNLVFAGWSHSKTGDVEIDRNKLYVYVPSSNETLYAVWKEGYKITLDANGGYFDWGQDPTKQIVTVVSGRRIDGNRFPVSNTANLVFAGWSHSKTGEAEIDKDELYSYVPSSSETLYAVWKEGYKITLDANGGYFKYSSNPDKEIVSVLKGECLNEGGVPVLAQSNMAFAGWSHKKTGEPEISRDEIFDYVPKGNETLYAIYKEAYTVEFYAENGYFPMYDEEPTLYILKVVKGSRLTQIVRPTSNKAGLIFAGWSYTKGGKIDIPRNNIYGFIPTKNEKLYAVYGEGFKITLDANGGSFDSAMNTTNMSFDVIKGESMHTGIVPYQTPEGLVFAGWSHTANGKAEIGRYNLFEYVPTKSETLYAVYEKSVFQFTDVTNQELSYYAPVYWAVGKGVTKGTSATEFSPSKSCTRAQFVTFLWRAMGSPEPKTTKSPFTDVQDKKLSYYKAVLWALENNITTGTDATHFSPSKACTRAQVATFLWRANGKPAPTIKKNPFTDVPAGRSFSDAVLWAYELGITTGTSKTEFSPNKTCTRAQTVTFLYRNFLYQ